MSQLAISNSELDAPAPDKEEVTGSKHLKHRSILVVDDEHGIRNFLVKGLSKYFGLVESAGDIEEADKLQQRCHFDLIIADIKLPGKSGVEWVQQLRDSGTNACVIFITAHAHLGVAIEALRAGAADFIIKPFRMDQILAAINDVIERQEIKRENFVLRRQVDQIYDNSNMIGNSPVMQTLFSTIKNVATTPATILIEGETGTGKELAAKSIHDLSERSGSFVPVNCGAIATELLESELFGHAKGAFTGAHQRREGLFSYADDGTLFLDEIGEMPISMQAHLLRALEEKTIRPVGSNTELPVNVRIIAATNKELGKLVEQGLFRADLYFRLNVINLQIPPLKSRDGDLNLLAKHFIQTISANLGTQPIYIDESELDRLSQYHWPGNVRELKNVIERSLLLGTPPSDCITGARQQPVDIEPSDTGSLLLADIEKSHILRVLKIHGGNKSAAARQLGVSRKTLERKTLLWGSE